MCPPLSGQDPYNNVQPALIRSKTLLPAGPPDYGTAAADYIPQIIAHNYLLCNHYQVK